MPGVRCLLKGSNEIMKETAKTMLLTLLTPKTIILSVALYNFIFIWLTARDWSLNCFIDPWYSTWSFTNEPTRLLLAACGLCLSMRWSYLAAIGLSGSTLLHAVYVYVDLFWHGELLASWMALVQMHPLLSLHGQYILAGVIFVYAVGCFRSSLSRRNSLYR